MGVDLSREGGIELWMLLGRELVKLLHTGVLLYCSFGGAGH